MATEIESTRSINDKQVRAETGKSWNEWLSVIEQWSRCEQSLGVIVPYLMKEHQLSLIWAQVIAVYYKRK